MKNRMANRVLNWLGNLLVVVAVVLLASMLMAPRFGISMHPVLSGSMEPALGVGGVIVSNTVPLSTIEKGDIISYKTGNMPVTHRVIKISFKDGKYQFWTKGDANNAPDPEPVVPREDKIPRTIFYVPYVGYAAQLLKTKTNFFVFVVVPAVLLLGSLFWEIWKERNKQSQDKAVCDNKE